MAKRLQLAGLALTLVGLGSPGLQAHSQRPIVVSDVDGLEDALTPLNEGRRIVLRPGTYMVRHLLVVPDGATLEGAGVMLGESLPDGFVPGTETRITLDTAFASVPGDLMTLGNGATIRNLIVEDVAAPRVGNVVAIQSREPGDVVSASIVRCEIINPHPPGMGPNGPGGRAIVVITQNLALDALPPPDEGADVSATVTRSVVRSTGGSSAIFAINFASRGHLTIVATSNRMYGSLDVTAGVSRPDEVTGATLMVRSEGNLYSRIAPARTGWTIDGASTVPGGAIAATSTSGDVTRVTSIGDVIDGFQVGIAATAGKRHSPSPASTPVLDNLTELRLLELRISTEGPGAADLVLGAALADGAYTPGDGNLLRVQMIGVTGSGTRANSYSDESSATGPQSLGADNRLEITGSLRLFQLLNQDIDPAPPTEFFRR